MEIKSLYLDTTFCHPIATTIPSRVSIHDYQQITASLYNTGSVSSPYLEDSRKVIIMIIYFSKKKEGVVEHLPTAITLVLMIQFQNIIIF